MPEKFNAKNLSYASKPPPFLAALQAQAAGHKGPDPIAAARRRPAGKKRSSSEEAEDVPLVVDEHGNALALEVDKDGVVAAGQHDADPTRGDGGDAGEKEKGNKDGGAANAKMTIGGRKRKVGKIVGEEAEDGKENGKENGNGLKSDKGDDKDKTGAKKLKKKAKVIKLSFDED
ncbi:hypothetical protein ISF_08975 [Cordyceps fumosorosea ARSEF 2679]|uniref:DUF4604 domain-containing protein n=1 Tax=Cordyceps fumosorosea (strain ARSEF 2679) TaxID=1081104 RepID=A0A167LIS8_CORFA|nr:hypothetical protein ISF_08975 [Cordyceps fumosorosea ARSEF 2679]OAA53134.1 hypothetical protein ISF_08975 [Cordyceps fumosorosea ARSEF 2679]